MVGSVAIPALTVYLESSLARLQLILYSEHWSTADLCPHVTHDS